MLPFINRLADTGQAIGSSRVRQHRPGRLPGRDRLDVGRRPVAALGGQLEAKLLMLDHAFGTWRCHRVEFKTDSLERAVTERAARDRGRVRGIFRNHMVAQHGRMRHSAYYAITDDDWPGVRERLVARIAAGGRRPERLTPRRRNGLRRAERRPRSPGRGHRSGRASRGTGSARCGSRSGRSRRTRPGCSPIAAIQPAYFGLQLRRPGRQHGRGRDRQEPRVALDELDVEVVLGLAEREHHPPVGGDVLDLHRGRLAEHDEAAVHPQVPDGYEMRAPSGSDRRQPGDGRPERRRSPSSSGAGDRAPGDGSCRPLAPRSSSGTSAGDRRTIRRTRQHRAPATAPAATPTPIGLGADAARG